MSGFMKTVLKNSATITHILPRFRFSFRPCKRAKIQRKEDSERQEKKEKKGLTFLLIFIWSPLEFLGKLKKPT